MFSVSLCASQSLSSVDETQQTLDHRSRLHRLQLDDSVRTELQQENVAVCVLSRSVRRRDEAGQVDVADARLVADGVQGVAVRVADDHRLHLLVHVTQSRQGDVSGGRTCKSK